MPERILEDYRTNPPTMYRCFNGTLERALCLTKQIADGATNPTYCMRDIDTGRKFVCSMDMYETTEAAAVRKYLRECEDALPAYRDTATTALSELAWLETQIVRVRRQLQQIEAPTRTPAAYMKEREHIYRPENTTLQQLLICIDRLQPSQELSYNGAMQFTGCCSPWDMLNALDHYVEAGILVEISEPDCTGQARRFRKAGTPPNSPQRERVVDLDA